ncbi:MAG TPA: penicillin-binding transpeptidase domain-containing protein [Chitinophagaceae bacterium]|nr:penicillin-binding transpeptidase domain-containing protein [Chitinophagaceae bacterium]
MVRILLSRMAPLLLIGLVCCNSGGVQVHPEWENYFSAAGVQGCVMVHDYSLKRFDVYNQPGMEQRLLPASTFKIFNSLVALETGIVPDTNFVIRWDGITRPVKQWNQDLTMAQAFRYSAVPYYQQLARRIGRDTMQYFLDTVQYGNRVIGPRIDSFWLDNSLRISPDEQLGFVEKLYFSQLPFKDITQRMVVGMMHMVREPHYDIYYKTGLGRNGNQQVGWVVGWELENRRPHFFALVLTTDHPALDISGTRMIILEKILSSLGLMHGGKAY